MATSYRWIPRTPTSALNNVVTAGDQHDTVVAANAAGTLYMTAWTSPSPDDDVKGRLFHSDGTPVANEFTIANGASDQRQVSLAALADGRFIAAYNDAGDIRARLFHPDGSLSQTLDVAVGPTGARRPDVTALADGGFAVSWAQGAEDSDVEVAVYNADGSVRHAQRHVSANPAYHESRSSITGLADGGFVVAWEVETGVSEWEVRFRRFDANGNALDGTDTQGVLIDHWGDINREIQLAALPDGGFVVAYTDDGWINGDQTDITAQVYNANGGARSSSSLVNSGAVAGSQQGPKIAVMADGHFVVSWHTGAQQSFQGYDHLGNKVGSNLLGMNTSLAGDLAVLDGSLIATVWQSTDSDGSGDSAQGARFEFTRLLEGGGGDDTITGYGDGIAEILSGEGGQDTLIGGSGHNNFRGGAGNDTIIGGPGGEDVATFGQNTTAFTILDFGSKIVVWGVEGYDQLYGIEHLRFGNAFIDVVDDGNGLFDTLYYLGENIDVLYAHVNALDHFNVAGRYEGRNPNAFFDTSGYLAANPDVAAAGINPLDHYHNSGWHEGRDPSASFDTTLYLIDNPDVAAAGMDPLWHFLQFGAAEGRKAHAAVGSVASGFDAQYYLFYNPDVAAAGIDPLFHYNAVGWQEGRNPNAYFNTAGYLAHNTDVAAAGINPLQHYEVVGWTEGRDPSTRFDTLGYLAANPDVAAANINPLDHFLQFGIYEGRTAVNDGIWH
jgi:hypothetical protein